MSILHHVLFFAICLILIYSLGRLFLKLSRIEISTFDNFFISLSIGIPLFATAIFLISYIDRLFTIILLLPVVYLIYQKDFSQFLIKNIKLRELGIFILILTIALIQCIPIFTSGLTSSGDLILLGAHGKDSLWHLSLINNIVKSIPPENPLMSQTVVQNYHYLTHIFFALISVITGIAPIILYFKIVGPFLIFLFTINIFILLKFLVKDKWIALLGTFFVTISSNYYYLVPFIYPSSYNWPSVLWIDEYLTRGVNFQLVLSYIVILSILNILITVKWRTNRYGLLLIALLIASLIGIKAQGFIVVMLSLLLLSLYGFFKKDFNFLKILFLSLIFSLVIYLLTIKNSSNFLIFSPFWFIKSMYETKDHLNFSIWELKRQTYLQEGNFLRITQLYLEGIIIFVLGNFGLKIIGLISIFQNWKDHQKEVILAIGLFSMIGFSLTMLFITSGVAWNSIQFSYYTVLFLSILLFLSLTKILHQKWLLISITLLISLTFLPGVTFTTKNYLDIKPGIVSKELTEALVFLKEQENGVVLIDPRYAGNALIPAIANKTAFLADKETLSVLLNDTSERVNIINTFFNSDQLSLSEKRKLLKQHSINYIFTDKAQSVDSTALNLLTIYDQGNIVIYKVNE